MGRVDPIARVIASCAPDVVLLQEATAPAVVDQLAAKTGMAQWRSFRRQSLAFMSREPVIDASWHRPRVSHHAFIEVVPAGGQVRIFGLHLSAVHAAWTERRRVYELKAPLAPGAVLDLKSLPFRLRPLVWLSGGRVRWRTIQTVLDEGYVDAFRLKHPDDPGSTVPAPNPHVRLDYAFVPSAFADRVEACDRVMCPEVAIASDHIPVLADLRV